MKKVCKKVRSILYRLFIKLKEKKISFENGYTINYLFEKHNSDKLIVVFSGFPSAGEKAKYNYMKTLKKYKTNKLFILDNFGYQNRGSYYLGENGKLDLKDNVQELIKKIIDERNIKKVYSVGSSKGGWAAIYYGTLLKFDVIISGAPQYYIGDYLNSDDKHRPILYGIIGKNNELQNDTNIQKLNSLLKNTLNENYNRGTYIVHFSKNEHTYNEHIKYLLEDLYKNKYNVIEDQNTYLNHSDVGIAMQKLLSDYLKKELSI